MKVTRDTQQVQAMCEKEKNIHTTIVAILPLLTIDLQDRAFSYIHVSHDDRGSCGCINLLISFALSSPIPPQYSICMCEKMNHQKHSKYGINEAGKGIKSRREEGGGRENTNNDKKKMISTSKWIYNASWIWDFKTG